MDNCTINNDARFAFISLDQLVLNTYNARRFEENMTPQRQARFVELTASIREKGVIEPLLVRPLDDNRYEIIAGERRYRAARCVADDLENGPAGYQVPCMIRSVSDDDAFDLMLIENLQRDDLTPLETAQAFQAWLSRHGNTGEAIAELSFRTGIPAHAIRRQMRLLELPAEALSAWHSGTISQTHAELLTRVGDREQILELVAVCRRNKLSTRELAERIGAASPDLERGFFDKVDCQVCHFNTSVQSGLFSDVTPGGKCGDASCFEIRQGRFLTENWAHSKAAETFGTRGFRFGHRLGQDRCEAIVIEPAERCRACDQFVSILRLNGVVVSGYARTCTGPVACFEELYRANRMNTEDTAVPETKTPEKPAAPTKQPTKKSAAPPVKKQPEENLPVFEARRAERFRKEFIKQQLASRLLDTSTDPCICLGILALARSSVVAKSALLESLNLPASVSASQLVTAVFEIEPAAQHASLQYAAIAQVMNDGSLAPDVLHMVVSRFGVDVESGWCLTEDYLNCLNKSEIVRIGEEKGVALWTDENVMAYREQHYKGKALLALKREELVEIILKSGVELKGRVPAEILGVKQ